MDKIKIVKYGGEIDPIYEEIGEIPLSYETIGRFNDKKEICIDIRDLIDFINRR